MAVIKRAIPKQQYLRLDEKVLYWIGVRRPASDSPSLLVLKSYFRKHPKQALLRSGLMVLFLGLLMSALILEFITLSEPRDRLFLCGLHHPILPRVKTMGVRCFSISVMLAFVYWNAFRSIKLDNSLRYEQGHSVSRNAILRRIYSSEKGRADLQTFLEKEKDERRRRTQKNVAIMERQPGFWKAFRIVTVPIIGEVSGSVLFELLIAIFSFAIAIYTLVIGLFYQGVDTKPLLMTSFGQIMPMLLLLVIALTAVEIGSKSID